MTKESNTKKDKKVEKKAVKKTTKKVAKKTENKKEEKRLKIGLFNDSFYPLADGVIMVVDNYARRLAKTADVTVFCPGYGKDFDDSKLPYKVVRCKSIKMPIIDYSFPFARFDRKYNKELKNSNLDIVHVHSPFPVGKSGSRYAKKHNIPVVGTMHSQFKQDFKRAVGLNATASLLTKIIIKEFNKYDECWAVNSEVANIFKNDYHYKTMPKVMNNATEMIRVDEKEAREVINKKHKLNDDEKVLLFVGRINALKNIFFIADAIKILRERNKDLKFKMLYVGSGQDEKQLKEYIKKNKLSKDVIMCGKVTDRKLLAQYFSRADLFLFPSLYDASSIVQIEAASQKTPGLFLEGSATSATVKDGVNGLIIKNDREEYAKKIEELCLNEKKLKKLSENAYKDLYVNWDDKIEEVYKEYERLIENKKKTLKKKTK